MTFVFLILTIILPSFLKFSKCCENIASITVNENIPYPSSNLLDVASLLQTSHLTSNKDKDNIYLTDLSGSKPFILNHGMLSVSSQLDREQICNQHLLDQRSSLSHCCSSMCCMYIGVTTVQGKTVYIKINIEDENDNEPVFPKQSIKFQIHENIELGYNIAIPKAEDLDSANFGIDRYDLIQDKNCGECFHIKSEPRDGGPVLVTKTKIDREQNSIFYVQVLAVDKGVPAKTGTLSVIIEVTDVNDNSPQFEDTSLLISEEENGRSGREIRTIKVTDADSGINGQISFAIEDYSSVAQRYFRLVSVRNGVNLVLQSTLDYEVVNLFRFKIIATDHGTPSLSSTITINVRVINLNDEPPEIAFYQRGVSIDSSNIILNVPENGPKQQNLILIHVTDKDSKLTDISCEVSYPKDEFYLNENQQVNIVEKKKLFDLQNSVTFDRESTALYRISIVCSDSNSIIKLTSSTEIQLRVTDVNDNAPTFNSSFYFGRFLETNSLGKVVDIKEGVVKVTDKDSDVNSRIKFSLADIGNSTDSLKFSITTHYAQIKNVVPIDFEEKKKYVFLIIAEDCGVPILSTSATITINILDANDNKPEFLKPYYSFSVLEEQPIGKEIGRIESKDADSDTNNKDLIFEIVNQDGFKSYSNAKKLFFIENNSGRIKTKVSLDREKDQIINFLVRVRNTNEDSSTRDKLEGYENSAQVTIKIDDINDNAPKLILKPDNQNQNLANVNDALKRPVITIENELEPINNQCSLFPYTFTDADEGINAEVRVSLKQNPHFYLETGHNLICTKKRNLAPGPYTVHVIGEDRNGTNGSKLTESLVNIVVKNTNSNKQQSQKKLPGQEQEEKSPDYKAIIILIVLIATIILFCFLLMVVVVKTKLCIPRNMPPPSRDREKIGEKHNNASMNKNYNIIMPGGSCENKRLCNDYIRSSLNNQNAINSDYSNNLFFPGLISPSVDILPTQYPNEGTLTNKSQSNEFMFPGSEATMLFPGTVDQSKNSDLRYEQLQRNAGHSLSDKGKCQLYNYLLEPRDSGSLPSYKQDIVAVAAGYQKSINDVYLQTSFV